METRTLDQKRAENAWKIVQTQLKAGKNNSNYVSYVRGLPAQILSNGLGQAMAMLLQAAERDKEKESGESAHKVLYTNLEQWLCNEHPVPPYRGNLMEAIVKGNRQDYMKAQMEALAWLNWLKKFAVAFLKEGKGNEKGTTTII